MKNCKYYEDGLCKLKINYLSYDGFVKSKYFDKCILYEINKYISDLLYDERLDFHFKCLEWERKELKK